MANKGLRKTEQVMPWGWILAAFPLIMVWSYWDLKSDIAEMEIAQLHLDSRINDIEYREAPEQQEPAREPEQDVRPEPRAEIIQISQQRPRLKIVRTKERVRYEKLDIFCLAKNIYHEAGVEDELGKYAVAQVTLNRMRNPKYPTTVCEVVMDPYQFSWANDRSIRWTRPNGRSWEQSIAAAENVLIRGYRVRGLEQANYYHADYVSPNWRKPEAKIAKIGTHIFYASAR